MKLLQKGSETGKLPVMNAGFLQKFSIALRRKPAFLLISILNMSNDRLLRGVEESRISTTLSAFRLRGS